MWGTCKKEIWSAYPDSGKMHLKRFLIKIPAIVGLITFAGSRYGLFLW